MRTALAFTNAPQIRGICEEQIIRPANAAVQQDLENASAYIATAVKIIDSSSRGSCK
jgi:hypothetical protein